MEIKNKVVSLQYKIITEMENEEETWTRWCKLCEMMSTFSDSNPYGTCQCS